MYIEEFDGNAQSAPVPTVEAAPVPTIEASQVVGEVPETVVTLQRGNHHGMD